MKIVRRKRNRDDSWYKEFLKNIALVTEEGCWVTDYYKKVNSRGQANIRYKNKYILLHQLSHLLFNSNVSDPVSAYHRCDTFACYNPTHLTDDLKEKKFKEKISNTKLFEGCSSAKDKKKLLVNYGNWLSKELGRSLVQDDFNVKGRIHCPTIIKYFDGSLTNYFNSCDFLPVQRKLNMTNSEMKKFLKDNATITKKGCWITDNWKTSDPKGRIQIGYKGKKQFLYRVSYALFKCNIPEGLLATHSCDNPPCYNPDHIFPDTNEGNIKQAVERGRMRKSADKRRKPHGIADPYDYKALLNFVKQHVEITEKEEWIFPTSPSQKYPTIQINRTVYRLHRLLLANRLEKKYDEIKVACHRLSDGSKPDKRDVNPDHLFEDTHSRNTLDTVKYHKGYKLNTNKTNQVKEAAAESDFSKRGSKTSFDKEWAAKLNVSRHCIANVRVGKTWKQ